jgi:hypothetical protein
MLLAVGEPAYRTKVLTSMMEAMMVARRTQAWTRPRVCRAGFDPLQEG